jgi:hypothetical protein
MRQFCQGTNNHPPKVLLDMCSDQADKQYDIPHASRREGVRSNPGEVDGIFEASNLGFLDMDGVFDRPIHEFLKVPTSMTGVEVRVRIRASLHPVPCDHCRVGIAHDLLPYHFDAMI